MFTIISLAILVAIAGALAFYALDLRKTNKIWSKDVDRLEVDKARLKRDYESSEANVLKLKNDITTRGAQGDLFRQELKELHKSTIHFLKHSAANEIAKWVKRQRIVNPEKAVPSSLNLRPLMYVYAHLTALEHDYGYIMHREDFEYVEAHYDEFITALGNHVIKGYNGSEQMTDLVGNSGSKIVWQSLIDIILMEYQDITGTA